MATKVAIWVVMAAFALACGGSRAHTHAADSVQPWAGDIPADAGTSDSFTYECF